MQPATLWTTSCWSLWFWVGGCDCHIYLIACDFICWLVLCGFFWRKRKWQRQEARQTKRKCLPFWGIICPADLHRYQWKRRGLSHIRTLPRRFTFFRMLVWNCSHFVTAPPGQSAKSKATTFAVVVKRVRESSAQVAFVVETFFLTRPVSLFSGFIYFYLLAFNFYLYFILL